MKHLGHPAYSVLSRSYDFVWLASLLLALLIVVLARFRRRWWIAGGIAFLVVSRSGASAAGLLGPVEAVILLGVMLACVLDLVRRTT